ARTICCCNVTPLRRSRAKAVSHRAIRALPPTQGHQTGLVTLSILALFDHAGCRRKFPFAEVSVLLQPPPAADSGARSGYSAMRQHGYLLRVTQERSDGGKRNMKLVIRLLVVLAVNGLMSTLVAQTTTGWTPSTLETMRRVESAALRDNYGYERLAHLSDNIGPRPVGSLQAAAAVDYLAAELRQLGFEVRLEKVRVPLWVRGEERAELVAYPGQVPGTTQRLVVTALGGLGIATPSAGITAEVLVVNSF